MGHDTRRRRTHRGVRNPDAELTFGQKCWRDMSQRAKDTKLRIEERAAIVAADAEDDTPGECESADIRLGWITHRIDHLSTFGGRQDVLVGWLAREIYVESGRHTIPRPQRSHVVNSFSSFSGEDDGEDDEY